jgi:hypothetical protein
MIEFDRLNYTFWIGTHEVRELFRKLMADFRTNWIIRPTPDFDVAGDKAKLPRIRRRDDDVVSDQLAPVASSSDSTVFNRGSRFRD